MLLLLLCLSCTLFSTLDKYTTIFDVYVSLYDLFLFCVEYCYSDVAVFFLIQTWSFADLLYVLNNRELLLYLFKECGFILLRTKLVVCLLRVYCLSLFICEFVVFPSFYYWWLNCMFVYLKCPLSLTDCRGCLLSINSDYILILYELIANIVSVVRSYYVILSSIWYFVSFFIWTSIRIRP